MNPKPSSNKPTPQFTYAQLAQKAKNPVSTASSQPQSAKSPQIKSEKPPSQPKQQQPVQSNGSGSQSAPVPNAWVKKPVISASKGSAVQFPARQPSTGSAPAIQFGSINQAASDNGSTESVKEATDSAKMPEKESVPQQQEQPAVGNKPTKPVFGSSNSKNSGSAPVRKPHTEPVSQNKPAPVATVEAPKLTQPSPRPRPAQSPSALHAPHPMQPHQYSPRQGHQPHPSSQPHIRPHHYPKSPMPVNAVPGSPAMATSPVIPAAFSPQQRPRDKPMHSPIQPPMSPSMAQYPYQYPGYQPPFDPSGQQGFYRPVYSVPYPVPVMPPGVQPRMNTGAPTFVPPQSNRAIRIVNPKTGGVVDLKSSPTISNKESPVSSPSTPKATKPEEKSEKVEETVQEQKETFTVPKASESKAIPIVNPANKNQAEVVKTPEPEVKPEVEAPKEVVEAAPEPKAEETAEVTDKVEATESAVEQETVAAVVEEKEEKPIAAEQESEKKEESEVPTTESSQDKEEPTPEAPEVKQTVSDKIPQVEEESAPETPKEDKAQVPDVTKETTEEPKPEESKDEAVVPEVEAAVPEAEVKEEPKPEVQSDNQAETPKEATPDVPAQTDDKPQPAEKEEDKPNDSNSSIYASTLNPEQLNQVTYPPNITAPKSLADSGTLKYDASFLLQFKDVCKDRPNNMPTLESLGIEENARDDKRSASSGGRRGGRGGGGPKGSNPFPGDMGSFKHTPKTSEERFAASQGAGGRGGFNRGSMGGRSASGSNNMPGMGSREGRGSRSGRHKGKGERQQQGGPTIPLDEVVPLAFSKERWMPKPAKSGEEEKNDKEILCRKVNGLLNKLTLEKFESISDKILEFSNNATEEKNGATLQTIIQLIFEKATDEPNFIMVYASLCRKMMDKISPEVMDEGIRGKDNKPVAGGALFRKYLLSRCQEEFEKGWKVNLPDGSSLDNPNALLTDEYYIAAKAKRRGLGLMAFIGELFKLQMLTERIMHECIKRLLSNVQTPEEEETESLCKLMTTVGKQLDRKEAKNYMDAYFQRMKEMSVNKKLNSRIRFMLLDVIDLRSNKWIPRREVAGPKTISQIHQDAQKQKEENAEMLKKTASSGGRLPPINQQLSRTNSERRDRRGPPGQGPDGWNTVGNAPSSRKTGDLAAFGNLTRSKSGANVSLGPGGGVFGALGGGSKGWKSSEAKGKDEPKPKPPSGNMFSALMSSDSPKKDDKPFERKPLNLRPRSIPVPEETKTEEVKLTKDEAESKVKAMVEEYLSVQDVPEVITCIKELGSSEFHSLVVSEFINEAIDKKKKEIDAVVKLFKKLSADEVISRDSFVAGILEVMEYLEDIAIDVPQAYSHMAIMMAGTPIELEDLPKTLEILLSSPGANPPSNKVLGEYLKSLSSDIGAEALNEKFQKSGLEWSKVLPKEHQSEEKIEEFLKKYELEFLQKTN